MITTWTQPTWGIERDAVSLASTAIAVALVALAIGLWLWRRAAGAARPDRRRAPSSASTSWPCSPRARSWRSRAPPRSSMRDGLLKRGPADGTLDVAGELEPRRRPARARGLRHRRRASPGITRRRDARRRSSTATPLTRDEGRARERRACCCPTARARLLRWRWLIGGRAGRCSALARVVGRRRRRAAGRLLFVMVARRLLRDPGLVRSRPVATRHGRGDRRSLARAVRRPPSATRSRVTGR